MIDTQKTSSVAGKANAKGLRSLFVLVVINTTSIGTISPVFPFLVMTLAGTGDAGGSQTMGYFAAAYAFTMMIFAPISASFSDRFGRRPLLLIATFGLAFDFLFIALAPHLAWLFVGRIISGVTASTQSAAGAFVADVSTDADRVRNFGQFHAVATAGYLIGPALGGLMAIYDPRLTFWVAGFVVLANGIYSYFVLPESLPKRSQADFDWRTVNPISALGLLFKHRGLFGMAAVFFVVHLIGLSWSTILLFFTHHEYGWGSLQVAIFLSLFTGCTILLQSLVASRLSTWMGERRVVLASLSLWAVSIIAAGFAQNVYWFCIAMAVMTLTGVIHPNLASLLSRRVSGDEQAKLQGVLMILVSIAEMGGAIAFTSMFAWSIDPSRGFQLSGISLLIGGALAVLGLLLALRYVRPYPVEAEESRPEAVVATQ